MLPFALAILAFFGSTAYGAASLSVQPTTWDFGSRDPGSGPSEPKIFTWTNTGDVSLSIFSESLASSNETPEVFWWYGERTCIEELKPGESCTTAITFTPSSPGQKHAILQLYPHIPSFPGPVSADVQLWGTGTGSAKAAPPSPEPASIPKRVAFLFHPPRKSSSRAAVFRFAALREIKYQCQLDNHRKTACASPQHFYRLAPGRHQLEIHGINRNGVEGPITRFGWFIRSGKTETEGVIRAR